MKEIFDFIKFFPVPVIISIVGTSWFHKSIIIQNGLSTANPLRMGQLYFIVFVAFLLPAVVIQFLIEKVRKK